MSINISGKQYVMVHERVAEAHKAGNLIEIRTEVLSHTPVVVKAIAFFQDKNGRQTCFSGISAANPGKAIEKQSPYEVAETSAVGRALGFAGFGIVGGIASAEEMVKAGVKRTKPNLEKPPFGPGADENEEINNEFNI